MLCIAVYIAGKLFTARRAAGDEGVFDVMDDLGEFSKSFEGEDPVVDLLDKNGLIPSEKY